MKKLSLFLLVSVFALCGCGDENDEVKNDDGKKEDEIKKDDEEKDDEKTYVLSLPEYDAETFYVGDIENPDDSWDGQYGSNYIKNVLTDNNKIFEFDCLSVRYSPEAPFGFGADSFAFTNCTSGNYSAVTKKGVTNKTYIVAGASGYEDVAIRFKDGNDSKSTKAYQVKGLYITNSVYAYDSMKDGAGYYGEAEIFGNDDSFKLTIYNMDKTKKVESYLAEGTNLLATWQWVDLTALGETSGLKFELTTTKVNDGGPLTPTYFCLDGITLIEK